VIDYTEFLAASLDKHVYIAEDVCWQAFRIFDKNGDGVIDKSEMALVMKSEGVQDQCARDIAELMAEIDKDGNGQIDFQEFMAMMKAS